MQEKLTNDDAIAREIALETTDILETFLPDIFGDQLGREFLPVQQFLMHAHDQSLFVVAAVENTNAAALESI